MVDSLAVGVACALAYAMRFGFPPRGLVLDTSASYLLVGAVMVPLWATSMGLGGGYDPKVMGVGADEYRRVLNAALRFAALVIVALYATDVDIARGFVAAMIPLATVFTLGGRYRARKWLHGQRARGHKQRRVVVVGGRDAVADLVRHLQRAPHAGFHVVGVCIPGNATSIRVDDIDVAVLGTPGTAHATLLESQADVLAVAGEGALPPGRLRTLAWQLEGSGVDLVVAPAVTDIAGPRIAIRPVAGLPLLHVEEPQFSGGARLFKECFDRAVAVSALAITLPFLVAIGVGVRLTSPGPALFRQQRVGRDGQQFTLWKFRTMVDSAESELHNLLHLNDHDGVLFKVRDDPRRTPLGQWLRRFSLDELPQLWHVVTGHMSLVGPRPPLPSEVERYGDDVRRRLLVKPGLTGLWQVSGRSDLPWEETVRLDLYYVDNWSPALDFLILWKTINAVIRGRGAY